MYQLAKPLRAGDTIGIVAPSSTLAENSLEAGVAFLQSLGYCVKLGKSLASSWGYLAGTDEARAQDIHDAFADDSVDGIMCLRGGYGATRLLPLLDYDLIAAHPKIFIGFSDITALHTMFLQRCHMATIHGTMVMSLPKASEYTKEQLAQGLKNPFAAGPVAVPEGRKVEALVPGTAEGTLCGGNIMLLAATAGTPYELDGTGGIVLLEEIGEEAYSLDRMLRQLEQSGLPQRAAAFVFGEFTHCRPTEPAPYEFTVKEIIAQYARRWGKPAVWGFPAGHGADNAWLPLGLTARLQSRGDASSLTLRLPAE